MTEPSKPPLGRRMKARAPPPPQVPQPAPRHIFRNTVPDGGGTSGADAKENMRRPTVDLQLTLPQGYQTSVTEDGSKALMDLLVELCSRYHLNPALHTLELLSPDGHPLGFKPNALLGSLNVACVLIKEKVWEDKAVRRPAPKVPEKTVRLMVNYHGSQKAVIRVNPLVSLQALKPAICEKCEFDSAHVLLLKDAISRHELPLDKSLAELGIKELYVHDRSLVLQPKMASAPALNYSDSVCSSTTTLGRAEKKGILGIFQFRKSKALSTPSRETEDRPSTLGQSQSVMNMSRMSPKADAKKRRAPAPPEAQTPIMEHTSFEGYQMGHGSESQQRKRKAPAPPPTPASITEGFDDTSTSAAPTPDSYVIDTPTPALRTKVAQSVPVSSTVVEVKTIISVPMKTEVQAATPSAGSPTPSSSTNDSLALQDSSSELSHSLDDSDADIDQACSQCSTLTSSSVSGSVVVQPATKSSSSRMEGSEMSSSTAAKLSQEMTSTSSSRSETESALNLKLDEVENNRHSAMAWLHSAQNSAASGQRPETDAPEEETLSLGSSSSGSSLPDQGYAASEGMAEGEDSGMVSSPSDTQPTSPDGSLSLDGGSRGGREKLLEPIRDNSSDSDEGCATWGSRHRHTDINSQAKSGRLKDSYEDDPELTAQLHQTLADFEADLADHIDIVSVKETPYTMSGDSNEVPVSVVDMDVPVTAIDEVLEEYESNSVANEALVRTESTGSKGPKLCHQSSIKSQNKNNNACTAADSNKKSSVSTKQSSKLEQHRKALENKSIGDEKEDKIAETKIKEMSITDTKSVKEDKQRTASAVKSNVSMQKQSKSTEIKSEPVKNNIQSLQENKPALPPTSQKSASTERTEEVQRVYQNNSNSNASYSKITHNVTSRFGMKTFTVVPPKPSVVHTPTGNPAVTMGTGAIKIDDQGNMVKQILSLDKVGGSPESGNTCSEGSPVLRTAKQFWSSNERQESAVTLIKGHKGHTNKAKENTDGPRSTPTVISETTKTNNTENLKTTQHMLNKSAERAQPKDTVNGAIAKEPVKDNHVPKDESVEVVSKISAFKNTQQPSSKSALTPALLPDSKRDLSFLKPSRRTSSQYVASAITKYTPKTSDKPNSIPNSDSSASARTQAAGFQRSGWSMRVNPHASSQSSLSGNKEDDSAFIPKPFGPKRSMSSPEYMSDSQARPDSLGSNKGSSSTPETEASQYKHIQPNGPAQINLTASNDRDDIKHIWPKSSNLAQSSPLHSSAKLPTAPKTISQGQTSNTKDMNNTAAHPTPDARPQPSVAASESDNGPQPVTVFGPVKKFRPVICRSVEKETSLHSSLMEAIQTGGGRERLKKISNSGPSSMKQTSYVEENDRSALLAAIRAQSSSNRLKKTKSEAADELDKFRKDASSGERSADSPSSPSPPSVTSTSPPVFTPSPAPTAPPPPPPPVLPQGKPSTVAHPSANTPVNPALAREAMLEAIRSGSAAERLKKVAVPTKTIQVNGRLGTIQATSPALPQQ